MKNFKHSLKTSLKTWEKQNETNSLLNITIIHSVNKLKVNFVIVMCNNYLFKKKLINYI